MLDHDLSAAPFPRAAENVSDPKQHRLWRGHRALTMVGMSPPPAAVILVLSTGCIAAAGRGRTAC
jgi:hypothetical protein